MPARRRMGTKISRQVAVALGYHHGEDPAPKVVAKGMGKIAERIVAAAKSADVPIHEDRDLAETLAVLEVQQTIPPEAYHAVAEILAYVYRMNRAFRDRTRTSG